MKPLPTEALLSPEDVIGIPREILDQAVALTEAVEKSTGISVAIVFHAESLEGEPGVPAMLAGNEPRMLGHLLGVAVGWAMARGLYDPKACNCPACVARRVRPVTVSA